MAQTRRHDRLRERVRAHMATVTWYTASTSSSEERNWSWTTPPTGGEGRIFNRNTRDPREKIQKVKSLMHSSPT